MHELNEYEVEVDNKVVMDAISVLGIDPRFLVKVVLEAGSPVVVVEKVTL